MSVRVLAVGPHPDDIEFGAGGWLALLSDNGVTTCSATFPPVDGAQPAQATERMREAAAAAECLNSSFQALPAVGADQWHELNRAVRDLLAAQEPDIVVTVDDHDSHPWHRAVARCVTRAVFDTQLPLAGGAVRAPAQLLYMSAYTTVEFRPDVYVDVTRVYHRAVKALRCHSTGLKITPMLEYQMRLVHQTAGTRASVELAEGFRLSHEFGQDWCARRATLYKLLATDGRST